MPLNDEDWKPQGKWMFVKEIGKKKNKPLKLPKSAWVFPCEESTPKIAKSQMKLQGFWSSRSPQKADSTNDCEPIQVSIHLKKPTTLTRDGKIAHGIWGYKKDGNKRDSQNAIFYPPWQHSPGKNNDIFEMAGYWSSNQVQTKTTTTWRFEGSEMKYCKQLDIIFQGTIISTTTTETTK